MNRYILFLCGSFLFFQNLMAQTITDGVLSDAQGVKGSYTVPEGVTKIDEYAFFSSDVTSITFPKSLKVIGNSAFHNCQKLETVNFASDGLLDSIGSDVFSDCSAIVRVRLPNSLRVMGVRTFWLNEKLEEITLPDKLELLPPYTFQSCTELREIALPASVKVVGENAFAGCKNLSDITLSAVDSIATKAFFGCKWLSRLTLPSTLRVIADSAFMRCERMKEITLPAGLKRVGDKLFRACPKMERITVDPANTSFTSVDGLLYGKDLSVLYECPAGFASEHYTVPASVGYIRPFCFYECPNVGAITLPKEVKGIGLGALSYNGMASFELAEGNDLYGVEGGALYRYKQNDAGERYPLAVLAYPSKRVAPCTIIDGTSAVAQYAFAGASFMSDVTLPASILLVDTCAFLDCESLKTIQSYAVKPPAAKAGAFTGVYQPRVTLSVPKGSANSYIAANGWQYFTIEEMKGSSSAVVNASGSTVCGSIASKVLRVNATEPLHYIVYDASGRAILVGSVPPGVPEIDICMLPAGLYVVCLEGARTQIRYKFHR